MTEPAHRAIVIGGGHNGLVAAFRLARAGLRPLVLEARPRVGGCVTTEEIHPGFRAPVLAHATGPLLGEIVREMDLGRHGLELWNPDVQVAALRPDAPAVVLFADEARTIPELRRHSPRDAARYSATNAALGRLGHLLAPLLRTPPPDVRHPSARDLLDAIGLGRRFQQLSPADRHNLLRWTTMPVGDLASEWFELPVLQALCASRGLFGAFAGPRSPGTSAALLLQAALDRETHRTGAFAIGGPGAIAEAMARAVADAGGIVRTEAPVRSIAVEGGRVAGVVLASGRMIPAPLVVSGLDPKRTLLGLVPPDALPPSFRRDVAHIRMRGTAAKMNLALGGLPTFPSLSALSVDDRRAALGGRLHVGPDLEYLERGFDAAKYGDIPEALYLDMTIPSVTDPTLAPDGRHVMSIYVQHVPRDLRSGSWAERRDELTARILATLETYAPDIRSRIEGLQLLTPEDLETGYGLTGGHIFHGEHALDQLFVARPVYGWARYRTPVPGLYLCGAGTHPGGGVTGACGWNAARVVVRDQQAAGSGQQAVGSRRQAAGSGQ